MPGSFLACSALRQPAELGRGEGDGPPWPGHCWVVLGEWVVGDEGASALAADAPEPFWVEWAHALFHDPVFPSSDSPPSAGVAAPLTSGQSCWIWLPPCPSDSLEKMWEHWMWAPGCGLRWPQQLVLLELGTSQIEKGGAGREGARGKARRTEGWRNLLLAVG